MSASGSALRPGPLDRRLVAMAKRPRLAYVVALLSCLVQLATQVGIAMALAHAFSQLLASGALGEQTSLLIEVALLFGLSLLAQVVMVRALGQVSRQAMETLNNEVLSQFSNGVEPSRERAGGLAIALTSGLTPLEGYFSKYLPALVQAVLTPLVLLTVVLVLDPLAALLLAIGLAALPLITARVARRANASAAKQWRALYALSARYSELLHGLTTLRLFNATSRAEREVDEATTSYTNATMAALRLAFQSSLAAEFTTGVSVGLTAMVIGFQLMAGTVSAASAFTILLVAAEIYAPLRRTSSEFHNAASGRAAAETLLQLIDQEREAPLHSITFDQTAKTVTMVKAAVGLPGEATTLPLSARLSAGEVLVIVGDSGTGKSTLLGALATSLGAAATLVSQRVDVFSATVAENLVLDGRAVSADELEAACQATGFSAVIEQLSHGQETLIGDGGVSLSAGELRKLALTRALLSKRPIVLLDEPTANLDAASVAHLNAALPVALSQSIVIMTAHGRDTVLAPTFTHDLGGVVGGTVDGVLRGNIGGAE